MNIDEWYVEYTGNNISIIFYIPKEDPMILVILRTKGKEKLLIESKHYIRDGSFITLLKPLKSNEILHIRGRIE